MKGFTNIGNTCYLNSGLQMLMQNIDLCNLIIKYSNESNILKIIADFIEMYYDGNHNTIIPKQIKMIVEKKQNMFMGYNQHDAAEFVIFLLDIIDEEIKKCQKEQNIEITGIDNIFRIETNIRIKCKMLVCLQINQHTEYNNYLLLDIKNDFKTLDDCYRYSKIGEKLIDDNMYNCSNCKIKTVASKRSNIIKWPSNLIICLKRFSQINNRYMKNNQQIIIPLNWRHNYKLYGAVIHSGSLNGGHYTYIGLQNDRWYHFNDSHVSEIRINDVIHNINNAYLLYYKMIH